MTAIPNLLRTSIQAKISAVMFAAVVFSVTITALTAAYREADRSFQSKRAELDGIAAVLASSVARPLEERDANAAGRTLIAIRNIPDIVFVQVLDASGATLIQFGSSIVVERRDRRAVANDEIGLFSTLFLRNYILESPVVSGGTRIGTLRIIANVSSLSTALRRSMTSAVLAGIIAAALGLMLAHRLQQSITRPISLFTAAISRVRARGDYAVAVPRSSDDETGQMVDAFNAMMAEVRDRDRRLAQHRDRLESEVDERTADLRKATAAAEKANAAKSEFLATMSHEIRTPLNGMLVMAELLASAELPERLARHAGVIVNSGQSLLAIINDILDLSKIEAGCLELERIEVEPEAIAEQVMSLFAARAQDKGLDLACYVAPDVPARIMADPVRLNQVLANLVNNALKFTSAGGVKLSVTCRARAQAAGQPVELEFAVTDSGIGIAADKLDRIFSPFAQADQSTTRRYGGTGIGLSISRKLVAAMGGELRVASQEGKGSTFRFSIAAETVELRRAMSAPVGPVMIDLPAGVTREVVADRLRDRGARVMASAEEAQGLSGQGAGAGAVLLTTPGLLPAAGRPQGVAKVVIVVELGDVHAAALIDSGLADALLVKPVLARDLEAAIAPSLDTHEGPAPTRAAREVDTGAFAGVHVLAADDVATNREVLSEALSRLGVKVTLVEDGQAAVRLAGRRRFDLILMDCSMPVMDGYQATRAIRDEETRSGLGPVPIVALTAHVAGAHANAWREAGMTATLSKPFTLASLRTCLERALGPRPAPESHSDAPLATEVSGVAASPLPPASLAGLAPPAAADPATAPVLDQAVLADILEMQAAGDDLVGRIADLYRLHAPPAMERLQRALETGDGVRIAETAHALKSLCRNIGAVRLGDVLHEVEGSARQGDVGGAHAAAARLDGQLDLVLDELARFAPGPEAARRAVAGG